MEANGLSKKVVDIAIKAEQHYELSDILNITAHKERPPKRLKSNVKQLSHKAKHPLSSNTELNIINGSIEDTNGVKGRKCSKCKHLDHYAKTCTNLV
ncbi:20663_t:CDS:2 [Funneliformis geosporum]|nr:20663_t:CDS:2 [Funneliformis geosporum]